MNQIAERLRSTAQDVPEQVPMLDEIANRINNSAVHASLVLDRLSSLGNRAFGP